MLYTRDQVEGRAPIHRGAPLPPEPRFTQESLAKKAQEEGYSARVLGNGVEISWLEVGDPDATPQTTNSVSGTRHMIMFGLTKPPEVPKDTEMPRRKSNARRVQEMMLANSEWSRYYRENILPAAKRGCSEYRKTYLSDDRELHSALYDADPPYVPFGIKLAKIMGFTAIDEITSNAFDDDEQYGSGVWIYQW